MPLNMINYTPLVENDGTLTPLNRVMANLRFGGAWLKEIQAQETVISLLRKLLSDRFTLVRNFTLPEEEIPIPLLLISGAGVWLIAVTDLTGIFKTQGKELLVIDAKKGDFVPNTPNLVIRTLLLSRAFEDFLQKANITIPPIEPVLVFTNPGVDVTTGGDTNIRVVLIDALNRFVSGLSMTPVRMEPGTTKKIVELIQQTHQQSNTSVKRNSSGPLLKFSSKQWVVIGAMLMIMFLMFILFIFLMLNLNG